MVMRTYTVVVANIILLLRILYNTVALIFCYRLSRKRKSQILFSSG